MEETETRNKNALRKHFSVSGLATQQILAVVYRGSINHQTNYRHRRRSRNNEPKIDVLLWLLLLLRQFPVCTREGQAIMLEPRNEFNEKGKRLIILFGSGQSFFTFLLLLTE